jgi:hypothetical protein
MRLPRVGFVRVSGLLIIVATGANGKTLFVTTEEGSVYSLDLTVRETS